MTTHPPAPRIYHITHVDNLPDIVATGGLLSDTAMLRHGGPRTAIGMSTIKQRRMLLPVSCHAGLSVGDCVPFYFCPRSVMLYVIRCANHPELAYRGGQDPIVHLEADLHAVVRWADANNRKWAFSLSNAGAAYAEFRAGLTDLAELDWKAIGASDFRAASIKEGKQAEFLVHESFPWPLVARVGVSASAVAMRVQAALARSPHRPVVEVRQEWYFP